MRLIKPSFEIFEQGPGLEGIYEAIERAGRTCYKSKRPEGQTAKDFVDRMINSKHYAMLEHGTVYLKIPKGTYAYDHYVVACLPDDDFFSNSYELAYRPYTKVNIQEDYIYVTTNLRVLQEHNWLDDLKYLCEPTEFHEKRVTVGFTTSNGIMRELTRHRSHSFAVESTRYCNYSKNKFNNEIQCVIPSWCKNMVNGNSYNWELVHDYNIRQTEDLSEAEARLIMSWCYSEAHYLMLTNKGILTAQQAREVLPLATKCDMVMTGFVSDWKYLFRLRTSFIAETGKPHPDMSNLCDPLYKEFVKRGFIEK